jgi:hypothetical protein
VLPYQAFKFCTSIPAPTYAPNLALRSRAALSYPFDAARAACFSRGKANRHPKAYVAAGNGETFLTLRLGTVSRRYGRDPLPTRIWKAINLL